MMQLQPTDIESRAGHTARAGLLGKAWLQVLLVLLACSAVYWPLLGHAGFGGTEGHRAIPAYHMLETGEWLVPHMFDRPYLRKPPGMPWAIAGSTWLLGQNEFAARAVSAFAATISSIVALVFARRWFGAMGGLFGGLAQALMPVLWFPARTADIESLHNLGIQLAGLATVSLVVERAGARRAGWGMALVVSLGLAIAGLTKGPAGATTIASSVIAAFFVMRSRGGFWNPRLFAGFVAGIGAVGVVFWMIAARAASAGPETVTQTVDDFLWQEGRWMHVFLLLPASLVMALPASMALMYPWGPDARAEAAGPLARVYPHAFNAARALSIAVLLSLVMMTIAGVSNPRYTMPAQMLIAPVAGYVGLGLAGFFILKRPPIARAMHLGHPAILAIAMVISGLVAIHLSEPRRLRVSGRNAGAELAAMVPPGSAVWADYLIEARPDVLWYAGRMGGASSMRIQWRPLATRLDRPTDPSTYLVLRDDPEAGEYDAYASAGLLNGLEEVGSGSVYLYSFRVVHPAELQDAPHAHGAGGDGPRTGY
jgi:4-amino-4-deoxy-L-arabinose transferase-like glycosyltransferase